MLVNQVMASKNIFKCVEGVVTRPFSFFTNAGKSEKIGFSVRFTDWSCRVRAVILVVRHWVICRDITP